MGILNKWKANSMLVG